MSEEFFILFDDEEDAAMTLQSKREKRYSHRDPLDRVAEILAIGVQRLLLRKQQRQEHYQKLPIKDDTHAKTRS